MKFENIGGFLDFWFQSCLFFMIAKYFENYHFLRSYEHFSNYKLKNTISRLFTLPIWNTV